MQPARSSSRSARVTRSVKLVSESCAPGFATVDCTTSSLPRVTSTSVSASESTLPQRDRLEMRLASAARDLHQGRLVQPFRLRQHGAGDLDDLVERERADDLGRRGRDRCQPVGEQRLGRGFDLLDQALEYVVEQPDMVVGIVHRVVDEEIGDTAQRLDAARDGAVRERRLQFVEQVFRWFGGSGSHSPVLERSVRRRFLCSREKWIGQFVAMRLRPCALAE